MIRASDLDSTNIEANSVLSNVAGGVQSSSVPQQVDSQGASSRMFWQNKAREFASDNRSQLQQMRHYSIMGSSQLLQIFMSLDLEELEKNITVLEQSKVIAEGLNDKAPHDQLLWNVLRIAKKAKGKRSEESKRQCVVSTKTILSALGSNSGMPNALPLPPLLSSVVIPQNLGMNTTTMQSSSSLQATSGAVSGKSVKRRIEDVLQEAYGFTPELLLSQQAIPSSLAMSQGQAGNSLHETVGASMFGNLSLTTASTSASAPDEVVTELNNCQPRAGIG